MGTKVFVEENVERKLCEKKVEEDKKKES